MKKQTVLASCSLFLLTLLGCSAMSIHSTESINWQNIRFATIQPSQPDKWNFAELIRQELTTMGINSPEMAVQPDLLITFIPEETEDLTQESQRVKRLRHLHLDFYPTGSDIPMTQVDYEFQPGVDKPDTAAAVRKIFAELKTNTGSATPGDSPTPPEITVQPQASPPTTNNTDSVAKVPALPAPQEKPQQEQQTVKKEPAEPTPTQTPSSWLPRFKSWGLEEWREDTRE